MTALALLVLTSAPDAGLVTLLDRVAERSRSIEAFANEASLRVTVVSDELDADGASTKHSELAFEVTRSNGTRQRKLLSATEDGKDVSEDKRRSGFEAPSKRSGGKTFGGSMAELSPFHPEQRAKYAFATLAPSPDGLVRVAFQPAGEKTDKLMIGDAAIDPATADLVRLSMRPSKSPRFVDQLSLELEFDAPTPPGRALSKLTMKGRGGVLFVKKRFAVVTTFSDYGVPAP
ncbi:MAG: hypothetical protein JNJ54_35960 [Myxococcaceae bacterium]|nr:hypothetical protein [Myxococcaceae bacterium]